MWVFSVMLVSYVIVSSISSTVVYRVSVGSSLSFCKLCSEYYK